MEHILHTSQGPVSVTVFGDVDKPALVTYPDVALNHMSCFQGLFFCTEAACLLLHNFCIYHIDPPGHELGAAAISSERPLPSVHDLADQVAEVLDFFGLSSVICMGVTAGAYILTLFAMKYRDRVLGLILVSPLCKAPSWTEWIYSKVISNLLYFYGMCGVVKEFLLQRYFSKEVRGGANVTESDIVLACRRLLDERHGTNVTRFLEAISRRHDITDGLKKLRCRNTNICWQKFSLPLRGSLHDLQDGQEIHGMLILLEYFLMGYGVYRQCQYSTSPTSPLSPSCMSPELLSPESMGLKLKPMKTRVSG